MVLKATHHGKLAIGDLELDCAVLEDGTRVLSQRAVTKALGGKRGGAHWRRTKSPGGNPLPVYISAKNLAGFIAEDLRVQLMNPVEYQLPGRSAVIAMGLEASAIPKICDVYLSARSAGALHPSQLHIAEQAEALVRALAKVGLVALIDEATGYQKEREKNELARLLSVYLTEERLKWAKMFPDEFYAQIYRLNGWSWPPIKATSRTPLVGKYTNDIVYERLPEGVLNKLKELNPVDATTKRRRWKHTQFLSEDIGQQDLRFYLGQVIALMRASNSWRAFLSLLDRAFPKKNSQLRLDI